MRIVPFLRGPLAAAGALVLLAAAGCSGDDGDPAAAPSPAASGPESGSGSGSATAGGATTAAPAPGTATGSRTPGPAATATPGTPVAVSPLPPAPVGRDADLGAGIAISMTKVADVQVKASGPGEIAGPGVVVTLRVRNAAGTTYDLNGLAVTASYGRGTPAEPSGSATAKPLSGDLAAGRTAEGTYYFLLPPAQKTSLKVEVSSNSSPRIAVFNR